MPSPGIVQRKAGGDATPAAERTPSGSGKPLPDAVRTKMEQAFRTDFSAVRIYEGLDATEIGALAFTRGTDIFFAPGRYQPETKKGQELLGHELAHVVQQAQGRVQATMQAKGVAINDDSSLEHEADVQGALAASGEMAIVGALHSDAAPGGHTVGQAKCSSCDGTGSEADKEQPAPSGELAATGGGCTTCGGSGTVQAKAETNPLQELHGSSGVVAQRWPGDGMTPPGDCSQSKYRALRSAVENAKEAVSALGSCSGNDSCEVLAAKIAAITTEIAARVALDASCFRGGDNGHRTQVQDKINALNRCYEKFQKKTCDDRLKQLTAQVASAARQAGDATAGAARAAADAAVQVFDAVGGVIGFVIGALLAVVQFLLGPSWAGA
jgi:Domain of unknown function (DUF4157)/Novel toxin 16